MWSANQLYNLYRRSSSIPQAAEPQFDHRRTNRLLASASYYDHRLTLEKSFAMVRMKQT